MVGGTGVPGAGVTALEGSCATVGSGVGVGETGKGGVGVDDRGDVGVDIGVAGGGPVVEGGREVDAGATVAGWVRIGRVSVALIVGTRPRTTASIV